MIGLKMLADRADFEIPVAILHPYNDAFVHQIPADVVKVLLARRGIDFESEIFAASRGAQMARGAVIGIGHRRAIGRG